MLHQQKETLESITKILEKLYDLNSRGYFTAWLDWPDIRMVFILKSSKENGRKAKKRKSFTKP